jgi:hypothetical protein
MAPRADTRVRNFFCQRLFEAKFDALARKNITRETDFLSNAEILKEKL